MLVETLRAHATPIRPIGNRTAATVLEAPPRDDRAARWVGRRITVTGGNGAGTSTVAMALGQGLVESDGGAPTVVVADLALRADLAMYHDARDVVPGLQELVDAHRRSRPTMATARDLTFHHEARGYHVLLGLRRSRDWTALRTQALTDALDTLGRTFRQVICDVEPDLDGEEETGSADVEDRNAVSRVAVAGSDVVVVVLQPSMKGLHDAVGVLRDLTRFGVEPERVLPVVNRAPRRAAERARLAQSLVALAGRNAFGLGPLFLPAVARLESTHRAAAALPAALTRPLAVAVTAALAGLAPAPLTEPTATPVRSPGHQRVSLDGRAG